MDLPTLVVFCRRPALGVGKRRLATVLGEAVTLTISELLLHTTLEDVADWPGPKVISPAEPGDFSWARALPVHIDRVVPQPAGNLGVRINGVDQILRGEGHRHLLFIGSDAPVLSPADYLAARAALQSHDVVLGPAQDGGVTCLGSGSPWPDLANLPWSSGALHGALLACCIGAGKSVCNLTPRYDVDVPEDLRRLGADLAGDQRHARQSLYQALSSLGYCIEPIS